MLSAHCTVLLWACCWCRLPHNTVHSMALTTLDDVVLAAGVHHRLIVGQAAQAHPSGSAHHIPGCTGTRLALGDGGQAAIAVGNGILQMHVA